MAYFAVEDFKSGLDVRRNQFTSMPGTLQELVNAHITRGGDIEKRKAFVDKGTFPANTFGLAADTLGLVTFGSIAPPGGLPAGVRYQQLQAPSGGSMTSLDAVDLFGGLLYVAATFSDGNQWHFYDGVLVGDWNGGKVMTYMANNAGIAAALAGLVNGSGIYTATVAGATLEVTGPAGVDYSFAGTFTNKAGGVNDQLLSVSIARDPVAGVAGSRAIGSFSVLGGTVAAGTNKVTSVKAGATQLLSAAVNYASTEQQTAAAIAANIAAGMATHGYSAYAESARVNIVAAYGTGAAKNGEVIEATAAGDVMLAECSFKVTGSAGGSIDAITAGGRPIIGAAVTWATDNPTTAEAVAAAIRAYASSPKYLARAIGETVYIAPATVKSSDPATVSVVITTNASAGSGSGDPPPVYEDPDYDPKKGQHAP